MKETKYSIIIPHKNTPDLLFRLLVTIPSNDEFEVIVVDDHSSEETIEMLEKSSLNSNVKLVRLPEERKYAGAARNLGLKEARGKWLIFSDSDDYFMPDFHSLINKHFNDDADIVYFHTCCVNSDTGKEGVRHKRLNKMLDDFVRNGTEDAINILKFGLTPPWSKMIKRKFIIEKDIVFDEVAASNDMMFSILAAYYAKSIAVDNDAIYCVTENTFGLTRTYSKDAWYARFGVALRANKFMRSKGLSKYQYAIPKKSFKLSQYNVKDFFRIVGMLIKYKQNPFTGLKAKLNRTGSIKGFLNER